MSGPDDTASVRARMRRLSGDLRRPTMRTATLSMAGFALAFVAGVAVGLGTGQPGLGALTSSTFAILGAAIAWSPLLYSNVRRSFELLNDHDCHELAEWKQATGSPMPRGRKASERWLVEHQDGPGRATILMGLGRLDEAGAAIETMTPRTPEQLFGVDIMRQTLALYRGSAPDTSVLHASWPTLAGPRERRHRRECLAILDAQIAVAAGENATTVLSGARDEVGDVHPSMRFYRLLGRYALFGVIAVVWATAACLVADGSLGVG